MSVVSVRLAPEVEAYLKKHKLKPGPFAKQAIELEIKRRQFREALDFLERNRIKTKDGRSAVDLIREDRDHGH